MIKKVDILSIVWKKKKTDKTDIQKESKHDKKQEQYDKLYLSVPLSQHVVDFLLIAVRFSLALSRP